MATKEIVGPVPSVSFGGGPRTPISEWRARPKVAYVPPRNTCDPRYKACTEHRVACDCREAEWAEYQAEVRYEQNAMREAFDQILAGHPTWQYDASGNTLSGCMCTGCQIARATHHYPRENS